MTMAEADQDLSAEIRVQQSMLVVRGMPVLILGNVCAAGLIAQLDWAAFMGGGAWIAAAVLMVLVFPLVVSYLRLRKRPRPARVSRRRIRRISLHSFAMGLTIAVMTVLMVPVAEPIAQVLTMTILMFLCYAAIALVGSIPLAALGYILPIWAATFGVMMVAGAIDKVALNLLLWIAVVAILQTCRQNWLDFRSNVALALERTRILRANLEAEVAQQTEIADTQRRMIDAIAHPLVLTRGNTLLPLGKKAARMFKVDLSQVSSRSITDFFVDPADQQKMIETQAANGQLDEYEVQLKDAEGHPFWVLVSSRSIEYEGEKCWLNAIVPIDERKRAEQEIAAAMERAEDASRAKSQFLANMSHELRTPMNAILGYTELILDNIYGEVPEKIRGIVERVESNGKILLEQINDVLDLSKIEAGEFELSLHDYVVQDVVSNVISDLQSLADEKQLYLTAEAAPDLPIGHGDSRRIVQVLLNLVGNALKFTDEGGVTVAAGLGDGGDFLVSVRDTGIGISEADQTAILDEFHQVDASSTRKHGGTGLGLSIARRMIELHGGRLWIDSAPGQGSTFSFSLPVRVEAPAEEEMSEAV